MVKTTKAQRLALKQIWMEDVHGKVSNCTRFGRTETLIPYRSFRRRVQPTFCMDGAVVVPIWSMFIAVEANGERHS